MLFFISLTEIGPGTLSTAFPEHSALSLKYSRATSLGLPPLQSEDTGVATITA